MLSVLSDGRFRNAKARGETVLATSSLTSEELQPVLESTLAAQPYLPSTMDHPPTLAVIYPLAAGVFVAPGAERNPRPTGRSDRQTRITSDRGPTRA